MLQRPHHTSPEDRLVAAIDEGNIPEVTAAITSGASVNCFRDGLTPTARAIRRRHPGVVEALLEYRPNFQLGVCSYGQVEEKDAEEIGQVGYRRVGCRGGDRRVPLLLVAVETGQVEVVRSLLQRGADPNETESTRDESVLHLAAREGHAQIVQELLAFDAFVNRLDARSNSPLHGATSRGHHEVARLLLVGGAIVNLPSEADVFPLHEAAGAGDEQMVRLLLEHGALVNLQDVNGRTALHHAAIKGSVAVTRMLLRHTGCGSNWRANCGETALSVACEAGHVGVIQELLSSGLVNPGLGAGRGASYRLPAQIAAAKGNVCVLELLLEYGALVNQRDVIHGETALHWAVRHNQPAPILALLQNGASPDIPDPVCGQTPLHLATTLDCNGTYLETVQNLLSHGANMALTEKKTMNTPLHTAAGKGSIELVKLFLKETTFGENINSRSANGETPLMVATRGGHYDVIRMLIRMGSKLNEVSINGRETGLYIAIQHRHYAVAFELLRNGSDVNHENSYGEMPLSLLVNHIMDTVPDEEIINLLYSMVFLGARFGRKHDTKSIVRRVLHYDVPNIAVSAAVLTSLQPLKLFRCCVAKVRNILVEKTEGLSILESVRDIPLPVVLKQKLTLEFLCHPLEE